MLSQLETNEGAWDMLKRELLAEELSVAHIMAKKDEIFDYIKLLVDDDLPDRPRSTELSGISKNHSNNLHSWYSLATLEE